jgi:5-methylcytosine-specific restriction endonuclease McrA
MLLCHRGCGREGVYMNYKNLLCCAKSAPSCPVVKKKAGSASGASRKGKTYEQLHGDNAENVRQLRVKSSTGRVVTESSREKSRVANKKFFRENKRTPWNKGKLGVQVAWNKGRRGDILPSRRKISEEDYKTYQRYKRAVYVASKRTYKLNENILNVDKKKLGRCGTVDAHQLDHKIPISLGYSLKIPVHVMADIENLQILSWRDNLKKSNKVKLDEQLLTKLLKKYKIELTQIRG